MRRGLVRFAESLSVASLVVLFLAPRADAACKSLVQMGTGSYPNQNYLAAPAGSSSDADQAGQFHIGHFWEPGKRGSQDEGDYGNAGWWVRFSVGYSWYLKGNLTEPGVNGCPGARASFGGDESGPAELIVTVLDKRIDDTDASFYVARPDFALTENIQYDMGPDSPTGSWADWNLQPMPAPLVTAASLVGSTVTADIVFADVASAFQDGGAGKSPHDTITAYQLCVREQPALDPPPGRDATAGWDCPAAPGPRIVPTALGGASIVGLELTCADPGNVIYLATRLEIDGGDYETEYVSAHDILGCCAEPDSDGDGYCASLDCDDNNATIHPFARQLCDGINNDCSDAAWPDLTATNEFDDDSDGISECGGDCNDANVAVFPGAPEVCDGVNNDCDDPVWPKVEALDSDDDGDGFAECAGDCDDVAPTVFPGAPQICDGLNNDCNDPEWPALAGGGSNEPDIDGDGLSPCQGDCDDANPNCTTDCQDLDGDGYCVTVDCDDVTESGSSTFPGAAPQDSPDLCMKDSDDDDHGDSFPPPGVIPGSDCDDLNPEIFPYAPQFCDGINTDCLDPAWPDPPPLEVDNDEDGTSECEGDCDDFNDYCLLDCTDGDGDGACIDQDCEDDNPLNRPGQPEICNGIDDDCSLLIDDDELGEDTDGDGLNNVCDNCREVPNVDQLDQDDDGLGDACDPCPMDIENDQDGDGICEGVDICPLDPDNDVDADGLCGDVDNCPEAANVDQADDDSDGVGDACDNCVQVFNPFQPDLDMDGEGDHCDLDDNLIYILFSQPDFVEWHDEQGVDSWNSYRGDLDVLVGSGVYTQLPGSNPLAGQVCGLALPTVEDLTLPGSHKVAFYLTTGVTAGIETDLGPDSAGSTRPNDNPCP